MQNLDANKLKGEWYPIWTDKEELVKSGFDASCFKQKLASPEEFRWIKQDSDEESESSSDSDEENAEFGKEKK